MALTAWASLTETTKRKVQNFMLLCKGQGTEEVYAVEVDQTTGRLPVDALVTLGYDTNYGTVGATTLRTAAQVGNATGAAAFGTGTRSAQVQRVTIATDDVVPASQSGTWTVNQGGSWTVAVSGTVTVTGTVAATQSGSWTVAATQSGTWSVDAVQSGTWTVNQGGSWTVSVSGTVAATQSGTWNINNISGTVSLPTGAATETTLAAMSAKLPAALGQTTMANSLAVVIASNQSAVSIANSDIAFNTGTVGSTTQRAVQAGRVMADKASKTVSGSNITAAAYNQLIASTAAAATQLEIWNSTGEPLIVATGAGGAEVDLFYIGEAGAATMPISIAASTRISLKSLGATATGGYVIMNLIV